MKILVPNLGSTSLKYQVIEFPSEATLARGRFERVGRPDGDAADHREAIEKTLAAAGEIDAAGFKAVHAGPEFRGTFRVDDRFLAALKEYEPAAPLHNGIYLAGIQAFQEARPTLPLVASVETGFHATIPPRAYTYGAPRSWEQRAGVRRYGFHGASHRFVASRAAELAGPRVEDARIVSCHLGGSSSMCAIVGGRSIDVTMGFSPQSGLENATRPGDLDPFAVLFMMDREGWSAARAREELLSDGGLAGISGIAGGDVRDLRKAAEEGVEPARLALDVFTYQVRKTIGAYAAAMGGLDAVAFTGGIGENSAWVRAESCRGLNFLGLEIDSAANEKGLGDRVISAAGSATRAVVLATNEELIVARETARLLAAP